MSNQTVTKFHERIEHIKQLEGSGTELVSVYLPPDASLQSMQQRIGQEHAEAQNIKSKSTRQNVQSALSSVKSVLQRYDKTPKNGLVVFSGVVQTEEGEEHKTIFLDEIPLPIESQVYHCDDEFHTEPLEGLGQDESEYVLIAIDRNDAAIGRMTNTAVETITTLSSLVPGKQKKGGQSQQRFERLRLEAIDNHYQKTAEKVNEIFVDDRHDIAGVIVGGPEITRKEFVDGEYLHHELQNNIVYQGSITSVSPSGIEELADAASDAVQEAEVAEQKAICEEYFEKIASGEATYGENEVSKAIEYGSVDTLLVSSDYYPNPSEEVSELIEETEEYGGDVVIMPTSFAKGEQFAQGFGGIGAILRYQID